MNTQLIKMRKSPSNIYIKDIHPDTNKQIIHYDYSQNIKQIFLKPIIYKIIVGEYKIDRIIN